MLPVAEYSDLVDRRMNHGERHPIIWAMVIIVDYVQFYTFGMNFFLQLLANDPLHDSSLKPFLIACFNPFS
ncbi:MAG: hypothetical protein ACYCT2_06210, partial [Thermoplasmataceae archaeon]